MGKLNLKGSRIYRISAPGQKLNKMRYFPQIKSPTCYVSLNKIKIKNVLFVGFKILEFICEPFAFVTLSLVWREGIEIWRCWEAEGGLAWQNL